jgi:hypothetical protein
VTLRRALLALAVALLVARPLVKGDNLDLLDEAGEFTGLNLTLLWLVAAGLWSLWRIWAKRGEVYVGWVELGLAVAVASMFVAAEIAAPYKHLARLVAWEWLGLLAALFVLRQLAVTPQERHGVLAAVLASGVAVAAYAVYQYAFELPALRQLASDPAALKHAMDQTGLGFDAEALRRRIDEGHIWATFSHPNSCAGYLALIVPGLAGAVWAARRGPRWRLVLTALCLLLGLAALGLTHSRGAILAVVVAAGVAAVVLGRRWLWAHQRIALGGAVALVAAAALVWYGGLLTAGLGKGTGTMAVRLEYWRAASRMIQAHPGLGVGPGQFRREYPRFMDETAVETVADPHNFALEMWTSAGPVALLGLLVALAAFFLRVRKTAAAEAAPEPPAAHLTHWPFYVGGMVGLVMGFLLGLPDQVGAPDVLEEGFKSAGRSVLWFLGFGLFERLAWTERARTAALATGVLALLLNLCVSGGVGFPQVALLMWACVALALNAPPLRPALDRGGLAALAAPAPVLAGLVFGYLTYIFYPVTRSHALERQALAFGRELMRPDVERSEAARVLGLSEQVIEPLSKAAAEDPTCSRLWLGQAEWSLLAYRRKPVPAGLILRLDLADKALWPVFSRALDGAVQARKLDPDNAEPYRLQYDVHRARADWLTAWAAAAEKRGQTAGVPAAREEARRENLRAAETLEALMPRDPTRPSWRFLAADALRRSGDPSARPRAEAWAAEALRLDAVQRRQPMPSTRVLTLPQRVEAQALAKGWPSPSAFGDLVFGFLAPALETAGADE